MIKPYMRGIPLDLIGTTHRNLNAFWYGTRDMSTPAERSSFDQLRLDYVFRSLTTFTGVIESKTASQTAADPEFLFCNSENCPPADHRQFRINTALSSCAVRKDEVIAVLSSIEKTAGISSSYIVAVNPKIPCDQNRHLLPSDALLYVPDPARRNGFPELISGKGEETFLNRPTDFINARL